MSSAARYLSDTNADFCGVNGIVGNFVGILCYVTGRITSLTSQFAGCLEMFNVLCLYERLFTQWKLMEIGNRIFGYPG